VRVCLGLCRESPWLLKTRYSAEAEVKSCLVYVSSATSRKRSSIAMLIDFTNAFVVVDNVSFPFVHPILSVIVSIDSEAIVA